MNLTNLISDRKLRFLRKIVEVQPICPVNVLSYRRQNNVALHTILLYISKFSIKMKTNKQQQQKAKQKTNKRYQNLKNNNQKSGNKIQKNTKPEKIMYFHLLERP